MCTGREGDIPATFQVVHSARSGGPGWASIVEPRMSRECRVDMPCGCCGRRWTASRLFDTSPDLLRSAREDHPLRVVQSSLPAYLTPNCRLERNAPACIRTKYMPP